MTPASPRTSRSSSARAPTLTVVIAAGVGRRRRAPRQPLRPTSGRDALLKHIVVSLGGKVVRVNPSDAPRRSRAPTSRCSACTSPTPASTSSSRCSCTTTRRTPRAASPTRARCRARAHAPCGSATCSSAHAATGTDSYEQNRNLVLTEGTRADSIPNLEIETGDIAGAGHASATGRFDDEQLFYLRSRGITRGRGAPPGRARLPHRDRAEDRRARARGAAHRRDRGRARKGADVASVRGLRRRRARRRTRPPRFVRRRRGRSPS